MELNRVSETPMIWFSKKVPSVESKINNPDSGTVWLEKDLSIDDNIDAIVNDFSTFELKTIIKSPTSSLLILSDYLKTNMPKKILQSIAITWPPRIQMPTSSLQDIFFVLAKTTSKCKDPTKFLKWSIQCLLPDVFSQNTSLKNPEIKAISLCKKIDDSTNDYWAILNSQDEFSLYIIEGENIKMVCKVKAQTIIKDHTNNSISIITPSSDVVSFIPRNETLSEMWCEAMTSDQYPLYLTMLKTPFPEQLISSIQFGITQTDGLILRSLIQPNVTCNIDRKQLFSSLLDLFIDAGKVSVLYENTIISDIESASNPLAFIYSPNSATYSLLDVLNLRYIHTYFEEFVSKLLFYIDSKGPLDLLSNGINDDAAATIFFTVMKYICASYSFVPDKIKHFFSILKHYISIIQNNRYVCVDFLCSYFFEKVLNPLMSNPSSIIKNFTLKNPGSIAEMRALIGSAFHHKALYYTNKELGKWDDRLIFKMFPIIDAFIFGVTECQKIPSYDGISIHVLNDASINILSVISKNNQEYMNNFITLSKPNSHGTCLSWNFAVGITLLFAHASDADELVNHANIVHNDYIDYIESISLQNPKLKDSPLVRGIDIQPTALPFPFSKYELPPEVTRDNILPELPPLPKYNAKIKIWKYKPPIPNKPIVTDEVPILPLIVTKSVTAKKKADKKTGKSKNVVKSKKLSDVDLAPSMNVVPSPAEMIKNEQAGMDSSGARRNRLQKTSSVSSLELIQIPLDLFDTKQIKRRGKKPKNPVRHSSSATPLPLNGILKAKKPKDITKVKNNEKEKPKDNPKEKEKDKKKAKDDNAAIIKKAKSEKNQKPKTADVTPEKGKRSDNPKKSKGKKKGTKLRNTLI